jgi:peptide-methionine (R)-S-oxide reductase
VVVTRRRLLAGGSAAVAAAFISRSLTLDGAVPDAFQPGPVVSDPQPSLTLSDEQWRERLTPAQYAVLRNAGTERPFTSELLDEHRPGLFACAGCDLNLFTSRTKFDSGTGWPSFWEPLDGAVATTDDRSSGMERTEVHCSRCGGHLGHVFDDGPAPTDLRYCINGVAMTFKPAPGRTPESLPAADAVAPG